MIIKAIGEAHAIEYDIQVNGFSFCASLEHIPTEALFR